MHRQRSSVPRPRRRISRSSSPKESQAPKPKPWPNPLRPRVPPVPSVGESSTIDRNPFAHRCPFSHFPHSEICVGPSALTQKLEITKRDGLLAQEQLRNESAKARHPTEMTGADQKASGVCQPQNPIVAKFCCPSLSRQFRHE